MDFLITLIGNAAVDPNFREVFLNDPVDTIDRFGFRLTKGDYEMMMRVFTSLDDKEKADLKQAFGVLEDRLYRRLPCTHPCFWSIHLPGLMPASTPPVAAPKEEAA
jgi:hypothetical protein